MVVIVWVVCVSVSVSVRSNHVDLNEYEEFVLRISGYEWLGRRVNWKSCGGWVVGWV